MIIDGYLIRLFAHLINEEDKGHFRLNDDPIGNGYDFKIDVEKLTIQVDSFIFEERCKVLTLKGDLLRMIIEYEFNEPSSPNAKIPIDFLDEMNFDQHASGNKSTRI